MSDQIKNLVEAGLNRELEAEVTAYLGREYHERREAQKGLTSGIACQKCGSCARQKFVRNGHRARQLVTQWGVLAVDLPRLKCECGGSGRLALGLLEPYQRWWDDVDEQIRHWADLGLSLRQMQAELSEQIHSSVGLRSLNQRLQNVKMQIVEELKSVPPILMLDAIWLTQLVPTGQICRDKKGRLRPVKRKQKIAILIALGVWGESGNWEVLDWELATSESQANWERLLVRLETRGVYRERGLELIVHDGGSGLAAALRFIYPHVRHQRCIFHKLRNIWSAIFIPEAVPTAEARQLRRALIRQASAIFHAPDLATARQRLRQFELDWQETQAEALACLQRDLDLCFTFFDILQRHPHWSPQTLRTTSLLERLNRQLRRIFRCANAYHSTLGLQAAVSRVLMPFMAL